MIIKLAQSTLFTTDPAVRFAESLKVPEGIWQELWRRYKLLDYSEKELREVFYIKAGFPISKRTMNRWIFRTNVYVMTKPMMDKGVQAVNSTFFGDLEEQVCNEILKNLKQGHNSNTLA